MGCKGTELPVVIKVALMVSPPASHGLLSWIGRTCPTSVVAIQQMGPILNTPLVQTCLSRRRSLVVLLYTAAGAIIKYTFVLNLYIYVASM